MHHLQIIIISREKDNSSSGSYNMIFGIRYIRRTIFRIFKAADY